MKAGEKDEEQESQRCKKDKVSKKTENDNDLSTVLRFDALCPFTLYLHWCQLDGGDVGRVHHGLGAVGSVRQEALPLLRQPRELLLPRVEARVDPVLKVRRS